MARTNAAAATATAATDDAAAEDDADAATEDDEADETDRDKPPRASPGVSGLTLAVAGVLSSTGFRFESTTLVEGRRETQGEDAEEDGNEVAGKEEDEEKGVRGS